MSRFGKLMVVFVSLFLGLTAVGAGELERVTVAGDGKGFVLAASGFLPRPLGLFAAVGQLAARSLDWLWPGRLALGKLAMLDGDPGMGKSLLALAAGAIRPTVNVPPLCCASSLSLPGY